MMAAGRVRAFGKFEMSRFDNVDNSGGRLE
jgi:hypothetical protein